MSELQPGMGGPAGQAPVETPTKSAVVTRFAYVGITIPAMFTLAALAAQLAWLRETPDPLATHWGMSGPDSSGPGWTYPLITLVMGFALPAWLWITALPRLRRGVRGWTFRFLAATALALATFAAVSMSWSVAMQRGLDSWQDAPGVGPAVITGGLLGIAAGVVGYVVQPTQITTFDTLPTAHVDVANGERVVWVGVARAGRSAIVGFAIALVILIVEVAVMWAAGQYAIMWIILAITVVVAVAALAMLEADVRVDADGVEVRGAAGWPRSHVAIDDVASASAITVEAFAAFGGWGWRRRPGALGVIMRSGDALKIDRKGGHSLVVTVDDAATAAALLTALVARART